eukprot:TRINITY_DN51761_c0_g1_i1.p1 TRINITY_DN51761_c0_g1~~TRINITY_DN51761_c0_g1_i1.p1  ORF type:complete len:106 (+),score=1.47 TRINITY_DN51761_c0_g1_i1:47-319(+)
MSSMASSILLCLISFRSCSQWVFHTLIKRPYSGVDRIITAYSVLFIGLHFSCGAFPAVASFAPFIPFFAAAHLFISTVKDALEIVETLKE